MPAPRRYLTFAGRSALVGLLVATLGLVFAGPARAHVDVVDSDPPAGAVVDSPPSSVVLEMTGTPGNVTVELFHRDGRTVPLTGDGVRVEARTVTVVPPVLDDGTYVLVWSSLGPDGHLATGQTHFSVGAADGTVPSLAGDGGAPGAVDAVLRWASYLAVALLLGLWWVRSQGWVRAPAARRAARIAAALALASSLLTLGLTAVRLAFAGGPAAALQQFLSSAVIAGGWLLVIACTIAILLRPSSRLLLPATLALALGLISTGHLATDSQWFLLVPLASLHLLAIGVWLGFPAAYLLLGLRHGSARSFVRGFTPWAAVAFVSAVATGAALVVLRTDASNLNFLFTTRYGEILSYKWGLLLLLILPLALLQVLTRVFSSRTEPDAHPPDSPSAQPEPDANETEADATDSAAGAGARDISAAGPHAARRPGILLPLEVAALVLVCALGAVLAGLPPRPPTASAQPGAADLLAVPATLDECRADQARSALCAARYFEGVAERDGVAAALREFSAAWSPDDAWMQANCHALGHKLGRYAYRIYQSVPESFAQGSDPCDYGYLHGVVEAASADFSDAQLLAAMTTLCEDVGDTSNHTYRQCIHGMGHAAARRVNNDLPRAMDFCRPYLPTGADPNGSDPAAIRFHNCVTGVSMEWNTQPAAGKARDLPVGAPGTLLAACLDLDSVFQGGCLEYGTSQIGATYEREIAAREWCDRNLDDPLPCYKSIGRDVVWSPTITPEQAVEICTGGRPGRYATACLTWALGSVATIALDADAIDEFCPYLPEGQRHLCATVREAMRTQIEQTVAGTILPSETSAGS